MKDKKKKKIKICKCSECGRKFEMPEEFSGTILCEDCDGFMNPLSKIPSKIKSWLASLAYKYLEEQIMDIMAEEGEREYERGARKAGYTKKNINEYYSDKEMERERSIFDAGVERGLEEAEKLIRRF